MVVDSIPPHAESGPNDHRKDSPQLTVRLRQVSRQTTRFQIDVSNFLNRAV